MIALRNSTEDFWWYWEIDGNRIVVAPRLMEFYWEPKRGLNRKQLATPKRFAQNVLTERKNCPILRNRSSPISDFPRLSRKVWSWRFGLWGSSHSKLYCYAQCWNQERSHAPPTSIHHQIGKMWVAAEFTIAWVWRSPSFMIETQFTAHTPSLSQFDVGCGMRIFFMSQMPGHAYIGTAGYKHGLKAPQNIRVSDSGMSLYYVRRLIGLHLSRYQKLHRLGNQFRLGWLNKEDQGGGSHSCKQNL
jgi:hypothetical protein